MRNQYQLSGEEDPELLGNLTQGTSQQVAPVQAQPSMPTTPPPVAPQLQMTPKLPNALTRPAIAPSRLPGMPSHITPDDLSAYLNQQKGSINKYGADAQLNLQKNLNARRNSFGYKLADAGKGFADALMMGVARAGNPGWQNQFEGQENQYAQDQMNTLKGANDSNIKSTEANMSIDKMNPTSALSKASQESYAPLFEKLGYPPSRIQGMSAANIENTLQLMAAYGGKEMEAKIKQFETQMNLAETQRHNVELENLGRGNQEESARKLKIEHPISSAISSMMGQPSEDEQSPGGGWKYIGKVNK